MQIYLLRYVPVQSYSCNLTVFMLFKQILVNMRTQLIMCYHHFHATLHKLTCSADDNLVPLKWCMWVLRVCCRFLQTSSRVTWWRQAHPIVSPRWRHCLHFFCSSEAYYGKSCKQNTNYSFLFALKYFRTKFLDACFLWNGAQRNSIHLSRCRIPLRQLIKLKQIFFSHRFGLNRWTTPATSQTIWGYIMKKLQFLHFYI